jgi:hypothetical protein
MWCNAGWTVMNLIGRFPGYPGEVWYNPDGIANILSLADAEKYFRVRYDSFEEKAFIVEKVDGSTCRFIQTTAGLYYIDVATASRTETGTALLLTVADKKSKYSERAYQQALVARKLQGMIGHPSTRDFLSFVDWNLILNCPITRLDILAAEDIFGPSVASLKGKTVCRGEPHVPSAVSPIPPDILSLYHNITLCIDIMYVNKLAFLAVPISWHVKFSTIELLLNRKEDIIGTSLSNVMRLYGSRGFLVTMTHADGEFEPLRNSLAKSGSGLNVCSNDKHVPEVERFISRCLYNSVPFRRFPVLMLKEMITSCAFWLNMFPSRDGVSDTLSPCALMTGYMLDYAKHCAWNLVRMFKPTKKMTIRWSLAPLAPLPSALLVTAKVAAIL